VCVNAHATREATRVRDEHNESEKRGVIGGDDLVHRQLELFDIALDDCDLVAQPVCSHYLSRCVCYVAVFSTSYACVGMCVCVCVCVCVYV